MIKVAKRLLLAFRPVPRYTKDSASRGVTCVRLPRRPFRRAAGTSAPREDATAAAAARNTIDFWSGTMAQVCDICGKGPQYGNNVSHAHNITRRRWNVNLQAVKAVVNGASKRVRVCTTCIKTGKVTKG
jgi:large subunit ribosomal protein L28